MKKIIILIAIFYSVSSISQTKKVAVLDFENTSGKPGYDALAKTLSNILITDLKNNIHPKKVEFFERSQLNKLLEEHKLPKGKILDVDTAINFGKICQVNYVIVGSFFVTDNNCKIISKLIDVKTSQILVAKEVSGKIETWLGIKSELAETIAIALSNPIALENEYKTINTSLATLIQYGKVLGALDEGDSKMAEQLCTVFADTNPNFKYFNLLLEDISKSKKEINESEIDLIDKPEEIVEEYIIQNKNLDLALKYLDIFEKRNDFYSNFNENKKIYINFQKARIWYRLGDFKKSISYYDACLSIDPNYLAARRNKIHLMMGGDFTEFSKNVKVLIPDKDYDNEIEENFKFITSYGKKNISTFNQNVYRATSYNDNRRCFNNPKDSICDFFSYMIEIPRKNAVVVWDDLDRDIDISKLYYHISIPTNKYCKYLITKNQYLKAKTILENSIMQQFDLVYSSIQSNNFNYLDRKFDLFNDKNIFLILDKQSIYQKILNQEGQRLYADQPDNNSLTENIIMLSELYFKEKNISETFNILFFFKNLTNNYKDENWGENDMKIENFKLSLQLLLYFKVSGIENNNLFNECKKIFDNYTKRIIDLYEYKNESFDLFLSKQIEIFKNKLPSNLKINLKQTIVGYMKEKKLN
jgi:TolB-like protein